MPRLNSNNIELEYEEFGNPDGEPVLLVNGWGVPLTAWPVLFMDRLKTSGHRIIAFDNRDVGKSQKIAKRPILSGPFAGPQMIARALLSGKLAAYTLEDMAEDTIGVLDALNIPRAHIVGLSMGGMITQIVGAKYPSRIKRAAIIMSSTNRRNLPQPPLSIMRLLAKSGKNQTEEERREYLETVWRAVRTQDGGYDEEAVTSRIEATIARGHEPEGRQRQAEAIFVSGDLRKWTRKVKAPTIVIHGSADLMSRPYGGLDIAANIDGARFELIPGMGHDLPPNRVDRVADLILGHLDEQDEAGAGVVPLRAAASR